MFRSVSVAFVVAGLALAATPGMALENTVGVSTRSLDGARIDRGNPVFAAPSTRSIADNYPDRASRDGVEGWTKVQCVVQATGRLGDCVVLTEKPQGYGFGAAAVKTLTESGRADLSINRPGKRVVLTSSFTLQ